MITANRDSFEIDVEEIKVATSFTFLGLEVEKEGRCDKEIKRRVAIGKSYNDWIRKVMARQTREHKHEKRIVRTLILPTVLYGCETWTMTKKMEQNQRM